MRRTILPRTLSIAAGAACTLLWSTAFSPFAAADAPAQYKIEVRIYGFVKGKGESLNLTARKVAAEDVAVRQDPLKSPILFFGDISFETNHFSFQTKDGETLWSVPETRDAVQTNATKAPPSDKPNPQFVTTIAEPTLLTPAGEKAQVQIVQVIHWFERRADGTFGLRSSDAGCTIACTVRPKDEDTVSMDWENTVESMVGRKEVPGVQLPIGEPIFSKILLKQSNVVKLGTWAGALYNTSESGKMLNLVRITEASGDKP